MSEPIITSWKSYPLASEALKIGYPSRLLFQAQRLAMGKGQLIALVGANGAGKSTLLKTLGGLKAPQKGEIYLNGRAIRKMSATKIAKEVSLVLTHKEALGAMTVEELVALGRAPYTPWHGQLGREDKDMVAKAIRAVGMEAYRDRQVDRLSDGERQKVMLARALAQDTPIILLDEPTAHLDLSNRIEIFKLLRSLADKFQKSLLVSTHELALAVQESDQLWVIDTERQRLFAGQAEELIQSGTLDRAFPKVAFDWEKLVYYRLES